MTDPLASLLLGDMRSALAAMEPKSVHLCITSPPFYAKRKYANADEQQAIWGDEPECGHEWGKEQPGSNQGGSGTPTDKNNRGEGYARADGRGAFCTRCGAWRGALGHEPTPALFIAHLVECFTAVKRVLRDDGVLVVEIGDSYGAGSRKTDKPQGLQGDDAKGRPLDSRIQGFAQTRIGIPERFALAMAADGWRWRDSLIWRHTSAMPESVHGMYWGRCKVKTRDRLLNERRSNATGQRNADASREGLNAQWADCPGCPKCEPNGGYVLKGGQWRSTVAHSYVYVFSKTARYYGDGEAVKLPLMGSTLKRYQSGWNGDEDRGYIDGPQNHLSKYIGSDTAKAVTSANLRSVLDIGPEPFSLELCRACRHVYKAKHYARLAKRDGKRVCSCGASDWVSHYATYPTKLPELFIRAFTSEAGCCPKCGAPWARVIEHQSHYTQREPAHQPNNEPTKVDSTGWSEPTIKTFGWWPTCRCGVEGSVPAVVLDSFAGTGSTLVAAKRNGRDYIGVDTSQDYLGLAAARLAETQAALR